jgi:predicted MarR family transcription regulator
MDSQTPGAWPIREKMTLLCKLPIIFILSMNTQPRPHPKPDRRSAKVAEHLSATPHELAVTQFEQGLICAAAAFYRFYGALLGREGHIRNISGQDNAILQQILAASRPLAVADIARFANRDDLANIQYSLKKLLSAGLIEKAGKTSARETSYMATALAREWTKDFIALRRRLFTDPSANILDFDDQLDKAGRLLNTIAGFYDHGTRVMSSTEQTSMTTDHERTSPVILPRTKRSAK